MGRDFLKAGAVGAVLSFVMVPTLLIAKLVFITTEPHAPITPNLVSIYVLYGSVSATIFLLVGLPMLAFFRRRGWRSWAAFSFGGAAVAIVGEVLLIMGGGGYWDTSNFVSLVSNTVILAVCGFLTGTAFWSVMKRSPTVTGR